MQRLSGFYHGLDALVTGADGFLGFNCVHALRAAGARVTALSRRSAPLAAGLADAMVRGDLIDAETAQRACVGQRIVFDFVGTTNPVRSNVAGAQGLSEECIPHLNLFAACAKSPARPRVVFCSSRLVYGKPKYLPVDELHPLAPSSFYAANKLLVEHHLQILAQNSGLEYTIVRLSNPYGSHEPSSPPGQSMINKFVSMAQRGETITLYGDGRQVRDYLFIDDAMETFLRCAAAPACRNEIFNLGAGHPIALGDAANLIVHRFGGQVRTAPWPEDHKLIETGDYYTDLSKVRRCIDLPTLHTFEQGLAQLTGGLVARSGPIPTARGQ
jgi:UDP-glucose 4-epimerase